MSALCLIVKQIQISVKLLILLCLLTTHTKFVYFLVKNIIVMTFNLFQMKINKEIYHCYKWTKSYFYGFTQNINSVYYGSLENGSKYICNSFQFEWNKNCHYELKRKNVMYAKQELHYPVSHACFTHLKSLRTFIYHRYKWRKYILHLQFFVTKQLLNFPLPVQFHNWHAILKTSNVHTNDQMN